MSSISPLGLTIIIVTAIFILALNLGLFLGVKQKSQKGNWMEKISNANKILKDPFKKEYEQYEQLSDEVEKLKKQ